MGFEIGDTVGAYKIVGELGSGGMGQVFKIEHTITRRIEAMKVLMNRQPNAQEQAQRFLREIQVQASLNHPNIASVHNAFWVKDDLVMVMELVEGDSLQRLLDRGPILLRTAIEHICQVLSALSYAHAHGVVHRDVSPANIIVTTQGVIKLTDFGLARAPNDLRVTQTGTLMGSLAYMPPEQIKGASTLDARTDIYSVGAVLYELVTGRKPFDSENAFSTMVAQVERMPTSPIEINSGMPPALNGIILKALAKDPKERFQSADLFRDSLLEVNKIVVATDLDAPETAAYVDQSKPLLARMAWATTHSRGLQSSLAAVVLSVAISLLSIRKPASVPKPIVAKPVVQQPAASSQPAVSVKESISPLPPAGIDQADSSSAPYRIDVPSEPVTVSKTGGDLGGRTAVRLLAKKSAPAATPADLQIEPKTAAVRSDSPAALDLSLAPPVLKPELPKDSVFTASLPVPEPIEKKSGNRLRKAFSAIVHPRKRKAPEAVGLAAEAMQDTGRVRNNAAGQGLKP